MKRYKFSGSVLEFDRIIANNFTATTMAVSKEKAMSNIIYRFKMDNNKSPKCKIKLSGNIKEVY